MKTNEELHSAATKVLSDMGGLYTVNDILAAIELNKMQSFSDGYTWVVTQVHDFPQKKVVEIVLVVGDYYGAVAIQTRVEQFARQIGASFLIASGRRGWGKAATDGWKTLSVNYMREL